MVQTCADRAPVDLGAPRLQPVGEPVVLRSATASRSTRSRMYQWTAPSVSTWGLRLRPPWLGPGRADRMRARVHKSSINKKRGSAKRGKK